MAPSATELDARAASVRVEGDRLVISLVDGRVLSVPLEWFTRLQHATAEQLADWRLIGRGAGIHWEALDEDISVPRLLGLPCE